MTSAVAIRGNGLGWGNDYHPASADSERIRAVWQSRRNFLHGSASDWLPSIDAALRSIRSECATDNWDGMDAYAIALNVADFAERIAERLYHLLPRGTPAPDIVPEPDGEIGISWTVDTERMFSLSVGDHGNINFAGQFGKAGGIHGWHPVDTKSDEELAKSLEEVVRHIARLFE